MLFPGTKTKPAALLLAVTMLFLVAASIRPAAADGAPRHTSARRAAKTVVMKDMKYQPATVRVKAGQEVEWKNEDIVPHTATSENVTGSAAFDSGMIAPGASWHFVPKKKGSFDYTCTFHPNMKGKLVVE